MTDILDKKIEAMEKILLLTNEGKLKWRSIETNKIKKLSQDDIISQSFISNYKDKNFRIYLRKYRKDLSNSGFIRNAPTEKERPERFWFSEVVLELADEKGSSVWQFPKDRIIEDILTAVKYTTSGAHEVIQSLLREV